MSPEPPGSRAQALRRLWGRVGDIFKARNLSAEHKFPSHHTHKIPVFNQVLYTSSTGTAKHIWIGEACLRVPRVQREPKVRAYLARVRGHGIYRAFEITGNAFISTNP